MDPLSITTALLSFIAVSSSCIGTLRRLSSELKSAPSEILAISNEISDLSIIVHDLDSTRRQIQSSTQQSLAFDEILGNQISAAKDKISALTSIVGSVFLPSPDGNHKFERRTWLRKKRQVISLKQDLVDIKRRLSLLLTSNSASRTARIEISLERLQAETSREQPISSQIEDVTMSSDSRDPQAQMLQTTLTLSRSFETVNSTPGAFENAAADDISCSVDLSSPHMSSFLDMVRQVGQFGAITFHVHRLAKCDGDCNCHCHSRTLYRSPQLLSGIVGVLFVGYAGLPVFTAQCNIPACSNQYSRVMQLSYTFPAWFLTKTIDIVAALTYTNEPSFGLKVRNRIQWMGENSIFLRARNGDKAGIIELFKQRKASPNDLAAATGQSPLHFALELGHIETCKFLLDIGVDPYVKTDDGGSAAHEISTLILSKGGARQAQKFRQYEPLFQKFAQAHSELWDFSYLQRVVIGEISTDLSVVLHNPCHRAELDNTDLHGRTALFWAALRGDVEKVRLLLDAGANTRLGDREGRIPLHAALISGDLRCTELLLMAGAADSVHVRDKYGDTALQIAIWSKDDAALLETLFLAGASLNSCNNNGSTSLQHAACLNHAINGEYLLTRGANPDCRDKDDDTPLSETVRFGNVAMMEVLLRHGASCNLVNKSKQTLLHVAALYGNLEVLRKLAAHQPLGLDADAVDLEGRTARTAFEGRITVDSALQEAFEELLSACTWPKQSNESEVDVFEDALEVMP